MKCMHVFTIDENNKFSKDFISFIYNHFENRDHLFFLTNERNRKVSSEHKGVKILPYNLTGTIAFIWLATRYEKIFFHKLPEDRFVILGLLLAPWLYKKCYWCIWGGDLYSYIYRSKSLKSNIMELIRRHLIRNMKGLITQLKGDYELAKKWYGTKGKYYYSFVYPSNLYKDYNLEQIVKDPKKKYIQVGNSACETNNHIDVFARLSKYKNENIEIICPLSYSGKEEYIKQVIESGYNIFGKEKFTPITDFMPYDEYLKLLAKVDVAIFDHQRQRGLGNIITLLGLGKKVYIREEITTWQFCIDHELKVYSTNDDFNDIFEEMSEEIKQKNMENVKTKFSEEKLVNSLKDIFNT